MNRFFVPYAPYLEFLGYKTKSRESSPRSGILEVLAAGVSNSRNADGDADPRSFFRATFFDRATGRLILRYYNRNLGEALRDYHTTIDMEGRAVYSNTATGGVYIKQGDYSEALKWLATHHRAREKRPHQQAEPAHQRNPGAPADAAL